MPDPGDPVWVVLAFAFGAVVGSFLNVVIWRLPRGESLVTPGSHCPHCDRPLTWWENVPLLSFMALRAKCRTCHKPIHWRYFAVELVTALMFAALVHRYGATADGVALCLFAAALLAALAIDLEHYIIPDSINTFALVVGVGRDLWGVASHEAGHALLFGWLPRSIAGAVICAALFVVIQAMGLALFRKDAMGDGDVKLARAIGSILPLSVAMMSFLFAVAAGAVLGGLSVIVRGARRETSDIPTDDEAGSPACTPWSVLLAAGAMYVTFADLVIDAAARLRFGPALRVHEWWSRQEPEEVDEFVPAPTQVPFGPYMVIGFFAALVAGQKVLDWYLQYAGFGAGT